MDGSNLKIGGTYWMDGTQGARIPVVLVRMLDKTESDEYAWRFCATNDCVVREDGWHSFLSRLSALSESR